MKAYIFLSLFAVGIFLFFALTSVENTKAEGGSTLYVKTTGNDSNPGTESQPFLTIQAAVDVADAGDTVLVYPGTYKETVATKKNGTESQRIIIKAFNRATETSDSSMWSTVDGENIRSTAFIINHKYNTIEGFLFLNHDQKGVLDDTAVVDANRYNIGQVDGLRIQHNVFEHTYKHDDANVGAEVYAREGTDVYIGYNKFNGIGMAEVPTAYAPDAAMLLYYLKNYIVEYNDVGGYIRYGGMKVYKSKGNSSIQYNYFHKGVSPDGQTTGQIYFRNTDITETVNIHHNLFRDNESTHIYNQQTEWFEKNNHFYNNTIIGGKYAFLIRNQTGNRPDLVWDQSEWISYHDNIISGSTYAYVNTNAGRHSYYTSLGNVYYGVTHIDHGDYTVATDEITASQNPLDDKYLSVSPYGNKGANLDVSVWPFELKGGTSTTTTTTTTTLAPPSNSGNSFSSTDISAPDKSKDTEVKLDFDGTENAAYFMVSRHKDFDGSEWKTIKDGVKVDLKKESGKQKFYVKFKDASGAESETFSETVEYAPKKREIKMSAKTVSNGDILVESGSNFTKNKEVDLYFSKPGGGYHPVVKVTADKKGKFSITYKVKKPKGQYDWYAIDVATGKKSKTLKYFVN